MQGANPTKSQTKHLSVRRIEAVSEYSFQNNCEGFVSIVWKSTRENCLEMLAMTSTVAMNCMVGRPCLVVKRNDGDLVYHPDGRN
jgi:hypothetical protein